MKHSFDNKPNKHNLPMVTKFANVLMVTSRRRANGKPPKVPKRSEYANASQKRRSLRGAKIQPETAELDDTFGDLMKEWDTFRNPKMANQTRKLNKCLTELESLHKDFQINKERATRAEDLQLGDVRGQKMKALVASYQNCVALNPGKEAVVLGHEDDLTGSFHPVHMKSFDESKDLSLRRTLSDILENPESPYSSVDDVTIRPSLNDAWDALESPSSTRSSITMASVEAMDL